MNPIVARCRFSFLGVVVSVAAAALAGCRERASPVMVLSDLAGPQPARAVSCVVPGHEAGAPTVWRVRPGDSLSGIAARCWGNPRLWPEILRANPAVARRGGRNPLRAGDRLVIPQDVR